MPSREDRIKQILESAVVETYPRGVGSVERNIPADKIPELARKISNQMGSF